MYREYCITCATGSRAASDVVVLRAGLRRSAVDHSLDVRPHPALSTRPPSSVDDQLVALGRCGTGWWREAQDVLRVEGVPGGGRRVRRLLAAATRESAPGLHGPPAARSLVPPPSPSSSIVVIISFRSSFFSSSYTN